MVSPAPAKTRRLFPSDRSHVHWQRKCVEHHYLQSSFGERWRNEGSVPRQHDSRQSARSDLAEVFGLLPLLHPTGPLGQLREGQLQSPQPVWVYGTHGLGGIVEVAVVGPL